MSLISQHWLFITGGYKVYCITSIFNNTAHIWSWWEKSMRWMGKIPQKSAIFQMITSFFPYAWYCAYLQLSRKLFVRQGWKLDFERVCVGVRVRYIEYQTNVWYIPWFLNMRCFISAFIFHGAWLYFYIFFMWNASWEGKGNVWCESQSSKRQSHSFETSTQQLLKATSWLTESKWYWVETK